MKKTGLITFHFAHHYGAQLQAYATMRAIQDLGASCEIIDFRLPHTTRTNELFKKSGSARGLAADAHTALHYRAFKARYNRFSAFVAEEMTLSPQRYTSFEALKEAPPDYDVYVAGSDQIWNPFIYADRQFEPAFLLDFVKEGRKIAYAPSLGTPELPPPYDAQLREYLASFDALSVREKRGQALIAQAAGREAKVVLDPTLLLTGRQWGELAADPGRREPYLLCYFVSEPGEMASYALALSERTGWPIVQLAGARRKIPGAKAPIFDAGPKEFLGLFQHAAAVCTNSFHGAVFSLQFQRPFFTSMSPKERLTPTSSRIYNLLFRLGAADRIVGRPETAELEAPMDYQAIEARLVEARADSLAYLKAAIEGEPLPAAPAQTAEETPKGPKLCGAADCTGCTACASVCPVGAITMAPDHEGFLRPVVSEQCILCRRCEGVCPGLRPNGEPLAPAPVLGVKNRDRGVLGQSTSGGAFSLLAEYVIAQGGVVFGAAFDETMTVRHRRAETAEGLAPLRQTKYVQSDLSGVFRQVKAALAEERQALFTGTPCQVEGLSRFLGGEAAGLITCDLVCHGVPSPAVLAAWRARREGEAGSATASLLFRDKRVEWRRAHLTQTFQNGVTQTAPLMETTFGRGFGSGLFLRPCCYQCPCAGKRKYADFTLGDFWGFPEKEMPGGVKDGVSMVLLNTPRARALWPLAAGGAQWMERSWGEATAGNPRLLLPTGRNARRDAFFAALRTWPFEKVEAEFMGIPRLPYRVAAKVLTPKMKGAIRKLLR